MQSRNKLEDLQAELLALKAQYGSQLHLKKTPATEANAPFPVLLTLTMNAPDSAEAYDISTVKALVTVQATTRENGSSNHAVTVDVRSPDLPTKLQHSIAQQLHHKWQRTGTPHEGKGNTLHLSAIFEHLQQNFVPLITSIPELLEPYQSVNADGATIRRYAIVNPDNQVQVDAHVAAIAKSEPLVNSQSTTQESRASSSSALPVHSSETAPGSSQKAPHSTSRSAGQIRSARPVTSRPVIHAATAALTYMQRRYGSSLVMLSSPTSTADSQVEGTHTPAFHPTGTCTFTLTMQPTDPAWDSSQSLHLHGQLDCGSYPEQRSFSLQLQPEQQNISQAGSSVANQLIAAEADQHAERPAAFQQLLRFVDNRAGMLFHEAEDIVLEAGLRRRQVEAQTGPGRVRQAPPPSSYHPAENAHHLTATAHEVGSAASRAELADASKQGKSDAQAPASAQGHTQALDLDAVDNIARSIAHADLDASESDAHHPGASEQESEGWSDSQWDSSASYAGPEQHTSDSEYQPESFDAEDMPHTDAPDRDAIQLQLQDLRLDNVDALEALKLVIQMVCSRCTATADMAFASDAVASGNQQGRAGSIQVSSQCSNCHQDWSASLTPRLVHAHSNVLASLRAQGCSPLDVLPSLMAAQCSNCSAAASLRNTQVGVPSNRACSSCHTSMSVNFQTAAFVAAVPRVSIHDQPKQQRQKQAHGSRGRAAAEPALVVGQPLPHMGTCKHYHHSHRWLRFPCCGRRFACDLCHEEQTDGHEMKWAQRMVCGYCSTEQPLGEQCKHCNKRIARSAQGAIGAVTRHWQGGEGCRDKKMMDRRDAAKYRGSKHKSVSKKSTRVGKAGAARRQRGQKADR